MFGGVDVYGECLASVLQNSRNREKLCNSIAQVEVPAARQLCHLTYRCPFDAKGIPCLLKAIERHHAELPQRKSDRTGVQKDGADGIRDLDLTRIWRNGPEGEIVDHDAVSGLRAGK